MLVEQGLAPSRTRARALIEAGAVEVAGRIIRKPSEPVPDGAALRLIGDPNPWVSRAALKLLHALDVFDLAPFGTAIDLGTSTGGFVQVLLDRGAGQVFAIDVGHGQLHATLRADPRVVSFEGTHVRDLGALDLPHPDWITADLSFISLEKALPPALALASPGTTLVALIKPQFEAGPARVGKGGIVRDPSVHADVRARIRRFLEDAGWQVTGEAASPIEGGDGNREFLIAARRAG